jgi:hypothetical protein
VVVAGTFFQKVGDNSFSGWWSLELFFSGWAENHLVGGGRWNFFSVGGRKII